MAQCSAKSKRTGKQCRQPAMQGKTVCYMHGGKSLSGVASPTYKSGRYSKDLPANLITAYQDAQNDPELLSVRQDIALIDAMLRSNFAHLDTGESRKHWDNLLKLVVGARKSYKADDYAGLSQALDEIEALVDKRRLHFAAEAEIRDKLEQRRKLVETEQKISLQGERAVTADQLMLMMGLVLNVINNVITDRQQRAEIASAIQAIVTVDGEPIK